MFINPKLAIEKGWIKGIKNPGKQIQPNAIDFTLDKVMTIGTDESHVARIYEDKALTKMRPTYEAPTYQYSTGTVWVLEGQRVYDGISDVYVEVPEGVAAILYTRSTFARNGILIASGLYDTGFKGNIGFTIYTHGGRAEVEQGVRVGQIAFLVAANAGVYAGGYNHTEGTLPPHLQVSKQQRIIEDTQVDPLIAQTGQSSLAKGLQESGTWNSDQTSKPAKNDTFL